MRQACCQRSRAAALPAPAATLRWAEVAKAGSCLAWRPHSCALYRPQHSRAFRAHLRMPLRAPNCEARRGWLQVLWPQLRNWEASVTGLDCQHQPHAAVAHKAKLDQGVAQPLISILGAAGRGPASCPAAPGPAWRDAEMSPAFARGSRAFATGRQCSGEAAGRPVHVTWGSPAACCCSPAASAAVLDFSPVKTCRRRVLPQLDLASPAQQQHSWCQPFVPALPRPAPPRPALTVTVQALMPPAPRKSTLMQMSPSESL